jgi:peptide-methionine (R)-S-oxide reductase
MTRRQLFAVLGATAIGGPVTAWLTAPTATEPMGKFPFHKTDAEWRSLLTADEYRVLRGHSTERAYTSPLDHEHRPGSFVCAGCGQPIFDAATKFDSGTGWPSFWTPIDGAVGTSVDASWMMIRTEVHCANCGGHLGHVFPDGPPPTGLRYCMNGVAMHFHPKA